MHTNPEKDGSKVIINRGKQTYLKIGKILAVLAMIIVQQHSSYNILELLIENGTAQLLASSSWHLEVSFAEEKAEYAIDNKC